MLPHFLYFQAYIHNLYNYANMNTLKIKIIEAIHMNPKVKGIIAILVSAIGFSFMSVFFRLAGDLPVFQKSLLEI